MKLIDKQIVEATKPTIYVGRRPYKNKRTGEVRIAKPYWAEYFTHGKQYQEPLGVSNKAAAIRTAYALAERLERGQQKVRDSRRTIEELADGYYDNCKGRGRAKKTLVSGLSSGVKQKLFEGQGHFLRMIFLPIEPISLNNVDSLKRASTTKR